MKKKMKLISCHIENFGKLSNFDYSFNDGLNTIKEENGFGKTTFASFIKAMFYGLESKRNVKSLIDRKKYEPWQGGAFGGSIIFEINDKKYKIERFFEKKEADDTFKIYDLATNLETNDYTSNIGEEIFKLNKEAFERSTFISGQNMETSMNDSINAKLGNILETENDINTSDQALRILDETIKIYKKTGGRGEINEKMLQKTLLEQKLEQSKIDEKNLEERKKQNDEIRQEIKRLQEIEENYKKSLTEEIEQEAQKAKQENYQTIKNNLEESKTKLEEEEKFFKNGVPEDGEIETLINKCMQVEKYKLELNNYESTLNESGEIKKLKELFENEEISEEIINDKISKYNTLQEIINKADMLNSQKKELNKEETLLQSKLKKNKSFTILLLLISIIIVFIGVIMYKVVNSNIGMTIGILGSVLAIIFSIKSFLLAKENKNYLEKKAKLEDIDKLLKDSESNKVILEREIKNFIEQYFQGNDEVDTIIKLTEIKTNFIKYHDFKNNINSIFEKQSQIMKNLNELESSIREYFLNYFSEITDSYVTYAQEMKSRKSDLIRLQEEYEKKLKVKEEYENTNDISKMETLEQTNSTNMQLTRREIEENLTKISQEINQLNDEKNYNKNQIETIESKLEAVFDIENDLDNVNEQINEMQDNLNILEKTKKFLEKAKTQFSSHYLSGMKESFLQNLKIICGNEILADIDVNLDVKINEMGSDKQIAYFSTGYKDLIYICMRLSLIDALFEGERPFVILDDPFVNLDESKIENAMKLLKSTADKYQVIYFICHESRR